MRPVNLLPESQRRRKPQGGGNGAYIALGGLAVLLVMTAGYVLSANNVTKRQNETVAASAEADRLEAQATELGPFGNFAQIKEMRVAAVRQLADSRFDWERLMRELSRVTPKGGWIQEVKASVSGALEGAPTTTTDAAAAPSGPSMAVTGCLPRQSDVADMMLRLRRMHRVEDVTLTESVISDLRGTPTLDNCGQLYQFDINVAFAAAAPQEAPDGETRVPAALGGGS